MSTVKKWSQSSCIIQCVQEKGTDVVNIPTSCITTETSQVCWSRLLKPSFQEPIWRDGRWRCVLPWSGAVALLCVPTSAYAYCSRLPWAARVSRFSWGSEHRHMLLYGSHLWLSSLHAFKLPALGKLSAAYTEYSSQTHFGPVRGAEIPQKTKKSLQHLYCWLRSTSQIRGDPAGNSYNAEPSSGLSSPSYRFQGILPSSGSEDLLWKWDALEAYQNFVFRRGQITECTDCKSHLQFDPERQCCCSVETV